MTTVSKTAMNCVRNALSGSASKLKPNTHSFRTVLEMVNLMGLVICTGIDTPYMGFPLLFLLTLPTEFPYTPPQGCSLMAGLISSRIHPNAYAGREQPFDEAFIGSKLSAEQKEALEKHNGKGCKLCREETAGWQNGKGWVPNKDALTQLAMSFLGVFNSNHPLENEPSYETCSGTASDTNFNTWVRQTIMGVYATPNFWEKLYSPEVVSSQELIDYFAENATSIQKEVMDHIEYIAFSELRPPSPYVNRDQGCFGFGRSPTKILSLHKGDINHNFNTLKAMRPAISASLVEKKTVKVYQAVDFPLTKAEMAKFAQSLTSSVIKLKDCPATQARLDIQEAQSTELDGMRLSWIVSPCWSEKYKWTFPVWKVTSVELKNDYFSKI